jgi:PKD repeat protein
MKPNFFKLLCITLFCIALSVNLFAQNKVETPQQRTPTFKSNDRTASSGLEIVPINNITLSIENVLFGGCVDITNLTFTGDPNAICFFRDTTGTLGIDSGLILSTGLVYSIPGPNVSTSTSYGFNSPGDPDLDTLCGYPTYDAVTIEFDFTPQADTIIACNFIFGSEEYPEFVWSSFNDVFGFYISGPTINGTVNLATLPNSTTPISIDSVNDQVNTSYYVDNTFGSLLELDGYTVPITLSSPVTPSLTYHFKITIADASDAIYDSGVFLKAGSFLGNQPLPSAKFAYNNTSNNTVDFTNLSVGAKFYDWDFDDGNFSQAINPTHTYTNPGNYNVKLTSSNYCYVKDTTITVSVTPTGIIQLVSTNELQVASLESGKFNITLPAVNHSWNLTVTDINGREINAYSGDITDKSLMVDLSSFASGLYIFNLQAGDYNEIIKVIR